MTLTAATAFQDALAQIERIFGPAKATPRFTPAMRLTRNGWMIQCRECEGDYRGYSESWSGVGPVVESRWQCEDCDGGWNEATPDDFDGMECIVDGRELRVFPHNRSLIGLDDDDNEFPIASIDSITAIVTPDAALDAMAGAA